MTSTAIHIAILSCQVRLKTGQVISTLITTQGKPGMEPALVLGNALLAAMTQYRNLPENNIEGFGIVEARLETVTCGEGEPEPQPAVDPKPPTPPSDGAAVELPDHTEALLELDATPVKARRKHADKNVTDGDQKVTVNG